MLKMRILLFSFCSKTTNLKVLVEVISKIEVQANSMIFSLKTESNWKGI